MSLYKRKGREFKCLIMILILSFSFIISLIPQDSNFIENSEKTFDNDDLEYDILKLSGIIKKIHIDNNWSDAKIAGLCTGDGTIDYPYVIKDLKIDGENSGNCILIENSLDFFRIENCTTYNTKYTNEISQNGIKLYNVANGHIIENYCTVVNKYGIYVENSFNINISGNTLENNDKYGIHFINSNNSVISNNIVNNNGQGGIRTENSHNNIILGNSIYSNGVVFTEDSRSYGLGQDGLFLSNSDFNNITYNTIKYNTGDGISIDGTENRVTQNLLERNTINGIYVSGYNNSITNNYAEKNEYGIYVTGLYNSVFNNSMILCGLMVSGNMGDMGTHNITSTNLINSKPLYFYINEKNLGSNGFINAGQVILVNCTNSKIENLNVSYGSTGIYIYNSNNIIISNNIASNNLKYGIFINNICDNLTISGNYVNFNEIYGISISQISNSSISGNFASSNIYGINVENGNNNTISKNNAENNYIGISLSNCFYNNISENNNSDNWQLYQGWGELGYYRGYGIRLENCDYNLISKNINNNNSDYGIFIEGYNNTLFDNEMNLCGLGLDGSLDDLRSHNISASNNINGKPLYYYIDEVRLNKTHFNNPGQIILINCSNPSIFNYNIINSSCAIFLSHCNNATISNTTLSQNSQYGLRVEFCDYANITENNVYNNIKYGLMLQNSYYSNITRNNATNNNEYGIFLKNIYYNNISENLVLNNFKGLGLDNSNFNNFSQNIINNNTKYYLNLETESSYFFGYGVSIFQSHNNTLKNNTINSNYCGIYITESQFNNISGNIVNNNIKYPLQRTGSGDPSGYGIILYNCKNTTVKSNFLENNAEVGISLEGGNECKNNIIIENQMKFCGIKIDNDIADLNTNIVNSTNLINNKPFYFYYNENKLNSKNFTNAGQVVLANCNNSIISKLNVSYSSGGITLYGCNNIKVINNSASFNSVCGVYIEQDCNNITILNNTINRNNLAFTTSSWLGSGIISLGSKINITDNIINYNNFSGITILGKNQTIFNNTLDGCGIYIDPLYYTSEELELINIDTSNSIDGKPIYFYANEKGLKSDNFTNAGQVIMGNCNNSLISDLDISDVFMGIISMNCYNITISKCRISNNKYVGLYYYSHNTKILNNNFTNNKGIGIYGGGYNNIITGNSLINTSQASFPITYTGIGIRVLGGANNYFSNNNISNNKLMGLQLDGMNHIVSNNTISNNGEIGIQVEGFRNSITFNFISEHKKAGVISGGKTDAFIEYYFCQSNAIYYNNFTNNNVDAEDNGFNNQWDDGFAGNYWSNYTGSDVNPEDGIGDQYHSIPGIAETFDQKPILYNFYKDYDGDGLNNYEEYTLGKDQYRTNVTNSDSDFDGLSDFWEWRNSTNPWNSDSDYDLMPDFWEVMNSLNPILNDAMGDADLDLLQNLYEFLNSTDPQDPDTDDDLMPDGWEIYYYLNATWDDAFNDPDLDQIENLYEYLNGTNPRNNDTDHDLMPDGWEINYFLNATIDDAFIDPDLDQLVNIYEYLNGTNPRNNDTDGDTFLDGVEVGLGTKPLIHYWYPMPNLEVLDFKAKAAKIDEPFTLNFTIINNGIWRAEDVVLRIKLELGNITLWDNFDDPIDLEVDETYQDIIQITGVTTSGGLLMTLELDPFDTINETYSSKGGSIREDAENNTLKTELQIERVPGDGGGFDLIWIILIIIGAVTSAGVISSYAILRPRIKRRTVLKRQIKLAKKDIENFKIYMRNFIKTELKEVYNDNWWDKGIPDYIKNSIENRILALKSKKSQIPIEKSDLFDFSHFASIITTDNNWELTFSNTFPNKRIVEENFENLRMFERNINEKIVRPEELTNYPLYIHAIRNCFTKGLNIFLSYSTLDADHFQIHEIAKRLQSYPNIDEVFFWEADSGENIVTYMERTLRISKIFVLFCSENALRSKAVEDEWQAAFQLRKSGKMKIVPVFENDELIPYLLMPLLNVKFIKDDFDAFVDNLYEEILRQ